MGDCWQRAESAQWRPLSRTSSCKQKRCTNENTDNVNVRERVPQWDVDRTASGEQLARGFPAFAGKTRPPARDYLIIYIECLPLSLSRLVLVNNAIARAGGDEAFHCAILMHSTFLPVNHIECIMHYLMPHLSLLLGLMLKQVPHPQADCYSGSLFSLQDWKVGKSGS